MSATPLYLLTTKNDASSNPIHILTNGKMSIGSNSDSLITDSSGILASCSLNIGRTTNQTNSNVYGTYYSNNESATRIAYDTSANRPYPGYPGYIRYNTDENLIEYWNVPTNSWDPITPPTPVFSSISPQYILQDVSSTLYTITGGNFNNTAFVSFIGNNDSVVYPSAVTSFISSSQVTCLISDSIADASNNTTFAVKITNTSSGFSAISGYIVAYNKGPFFNTAPNANLGTGISGQTYTTGTSPFTDLSASEVPPANLPISYLATSTPLNGSAPLVILDSSLGRLYGTMPTTASSSNYGFSAYVQDASGARSNISNFIFTVAPLTLVYSSGASLPSPIYVNSSNTIVGGPVVGGFTIYRFIVTVNQFTSTTYSFTINGTVPSAIDFLCVGGGGGAPAYNSAGGGGAGGFRTSYTTNTGLSGRGGPLESKITFTSGTIYTVTVGGGSRGVPGNGEIFSGSPTEVAQGFASSITGSGFTTIISYGGSPGGCNQSGATKPQDYVNKVATGSQPSAGCGGGARGEVSNGTNIAGTGTANQGYDGGGNNSGTYAGNYPGGGGGGAGSAGGQVTTTTTAGNGGNGLQSAITGTSQFYAGGGGGSTQGTTTGAGTGGSGVGGNGVASTGASTNGFDGSSNTGSGGGAGAFSNISPSSARGGNGSAGIVIIRFPSA